MQSPKTKKKWQTPHFEIISYGDVNSGSHPGVNERSLHGTGNYIKTLTKTYGLPKSIASQLGKNPNGVFGKQSQAGSS